MSKASLQQHNTPILSNSDYRALEDLSFPKQIELQCGETYEQYLKSYDPPSAFESPNAFKKGDQILHVEQIDKRKLGSLISTGSPVNQSVDNDPDSNYQKIAPNPRIN